MKSNVGLENAVRVFDWKRLLNLSKSEANSFLKRRSKLMIGFNKYNLSSITNRRHDWFHL